MVKKSENIQQLNVFGKRLIQLADDTTLFIKNAAQIPEALKVISVFSKASGLHLILSKCEVMPIHDHPLVSIQGIAFKKETKYLGINICKDLHYREKANIDNIMLKSKASLNSWLQRDLFIFGRLL